MDVEMIEKIAAGTLCEKPEWQGYFVTAAIAMFEHEEFRTFKHWVIPTVLWSLEYGPKCTPEEFAEIVREYFEVHFFANHMVLESAPSTMKDDGSMDYADWLANRAKEFVHMYGATFTRLPE